MIRLNSRKSSFLLPLLIAGLFTTAGCKTREDIAREQMMDQMSMQMQDGQKLNADFSIRLQNLEERISGLSGSIEETQHSTQTTLNEKINTLEEKVKLIEQTQTKQNTDLDTIKEELASQKKYIQEVLGTLKTISQKKSKPAAKKQTPYQRAMSLYGKGRYKSAKQELLPLLDSKKLGSSQNARVIHNLGMIAYMDNENEKALAYFSRLFTEYPKTGYNKNGLMFLAKTLKRMKKNEEAKQALGELISRFPKAKQVAEAKKMMKAL